MVGSTGNPKTTAEVGRGVTYLPARLARATERGGAITFITSGERVEWAQLHQDARIMAAGLQARGVSPGDHVAILGPTSRQLVTAIQATWLAGATVVVLPLPMRMGSLEEFIGQTRARTRAAEAVVVAADPVLSGFIVPEPDDPPLALFEELAAAGSEWSYEAPKEDPEALAILQFTSGSTSDPKGVMLPHATVCANLDAMMAATGFDPDVDKLAGWLPLYHDMGLIGILSVPMTSGADLILASPLDFLGSPGRWMEWMSEYQATISAGPNFAYALATRALRRAAPGSLDLSRWRIALSGAESVDPDVVEGFLAAGAPFGLRPGAAFPAFGMAEATLAVTFPEPGRGLRTDAVDRRVLETEGYAAETAVGSDGARRVVRLGSPVPGLEIRITDPETGASRHEREVGEIEIRGTSVTSGYFQRPDATAATFRDGWLRTGDLGYLVEGELVVCGRIKDLIIVGGRNVSPEDVERAAASVEGVRDGNVIAFSVDGSRGKENLIVVAESRSDDVVDLRRAVVGRVRDVIGLPPEDVVFVEPGTLPKTSSGKLQRSLCRERYLTSALQPR
jgi:fatty-acyl-CoA synthase